MRKLIYVSAFIFWTISFSQEMEKPNFLFIAIDDLRPELGLYGKKHIQSPNLDSLAKTSLVFNRAYCNIPVCGASRASILTGTRPTRKRFLDYKTYKDIDYPEAISLPDLLKQNGYTTISNGKIYHHQFDDSLAWDQIWKSNIKTTIGMNGKKISTNDVERGIPFLMSDLPDSLMTDGDLALKVISDLRTLKKESKPFFLTMGIVKPHLPFIIPKKYWDLYKREDIELPESYIRPESIPKKAYHNYGELRNYETIPKKGNLPDHLAKQLIHGYYASVSFIDAQLGLVFEELKKLNLAKNTIVVIWGDHGWNLGDHMLWCKHCTFETSLRAPLLIKVPGITKGTYTDNITEFIDIYPSICDLAGIEKPKQLEGESFIPLMYGKGRKKNFAVSKFKSAVTLIKGEFFYTEWIDEETNIVDRMLFDHKTDPLELDNLAVKEENRDLITKLSTELREKWEKISDTNNSSNISKRNFKRNIRRKS